MAEVFPHPAPSPSFPPCFPHSRECLAELSKIPKPQKCFYAFWHQWIHGNQAEWAFTFEERTLLFWERNGIRSEKLDFEFSGLVKVLFASPPFISSLVTRSLLNAWTTSTRIPDGKTRRSCIFQCNASHSEDKLAHYCRCDVLWSFIEAAFRLPPTSPA